jgi:hypothetical protein
MNCASGTYDVLFAQQKTAKECREEWRVNKAANQSNGVTEKAYVVQCRGGAAPAQTSVLAQWLPSGDGSRNVGRVSTANAERPVRGVDLIVAVAALRAG